MPCAKLFLSLFLNIIYTPFGVHKLSPFEIITEHPKHLAPASFEPQLIKGNILQIPNAEGFYKNNHVLVMHSSQFALGTLGITPCNLKILFIRKDTCRKILTLIRKAPIRYY